MSGMPVNLQGNHACALGAVAAGCRFYAGYPITPSSEVAERMARELPRVGGVFIQMEDEIASLGAVLGASMGGTKAMTATSGPGFSLMQEHLGYAVMTEIPCVIVNVMRGGPSTGMPTRPAQGDIQQSRWGTHGDHPVIVLTPASVQECFEEAVRAFSLAERFRTPVVLLYDEVVGHLVETVVLPDAGSVEIDERPWATSPVGDFRPYAAGPDGIPRMPRPGDGYRAHCTGLTHGEDGFPTQSPTEVERMMRRLLTKLDPHLDHIQRVEALSCDDAEVVIIAVGIAARAALRAVKSLRRRGVRAGLFRPLTVWPFPVLALLQATRQAAAVVVAEMNNGQLLLEIERHVPSDAVVIPVQRMDGEAIMPATIETAVLQEPRLRVPQAVSG